MIRPRCCSVNFAGLIDGMGAQWGRSHFVLAEFLKPNMTFIHTDSFDDVASARDVMAKCANNSAHVQGTKMATYHHMTRLVANMAPPIGRLRVRAMRRANENYGKSGERPDAFASTEGCARRPMAEGSASMPGAPEHRARASGDR